MSTELQIALWGTATVAPLALNILTKRSADAVGLSLMIVMIWLLGRVFWMLYTPPEAMQWYPVIDAVAGAFVFQAWLRRPVFWKVALTALFVAQCVLHAAFWMSWPADGSLLSYLVANNLLFALQLLCVSAPGGFHVARLVGHWLSDRPRGAHHVRA